MNQNIWLARTLVLFMALSLMSGTAWADSSDRSMAGRVSLRLGSGLSTHTLDNDDGPFFFADCAVGYGLFGGLSLELQYAFTFLRTNTDDVASGVASQVHGVMPGLRYRFLDGFFVPYAGAHLGLARTEDDLHIGGEDKSMKATGFVADLRGGFELFLGRSFAFDIFASYNVATNVPAVNNDDDRVKKTANYFFVGAGILIAI